jgi:ATP adenylyltransferase/5',5'''-P-1,P-4-tetraphosphate phosphorylase II
MLSDTIANRFPHEATDELPTVVRSFYRDQIRSWPMLAEGVNALASVQTRNIRLDDATVLLQFNPKRIVSTAAKVDPASIKERRCFLCVDNLPAEQRGILYRDTFLILCNPMPIFAEHFTVSHIDHIPQSIEEQILPMLDLAKDLEGSHAVFYNGPKCGASAPDHMHFQACPAGSIPVENESLDPSRRRHVRTIASVSVSMLERYHRGVIVLSGQQRQDMELTFLRMTGAMRKMTNTVDEPMMNIICSYSGGTWNLIVIPRTKHRPGVYFLEDDRKILISPAAVDIGGMIVTPAEKDFHGVDAGTIDRIFREVTVNDDTIHSLIRSL